MELSISLLVIKTDQLNAVKSFYEQLGLHFQEERHGNGPVHFSATLAHGEVFEIYPGPRSKDETSIGFTAGAKERLPEFVNRHFGPTSFQQIIRDGKTVFIVRDPDGRRVELVQSS